MNKNIIRALEKQNIPYQILSLGTNQKLTASEVAAILAVPEEVVYKTIVLVSKSSGKPILVLINASALVDTKKVALALNEKKTHVSTHDEAERITGLQTGGISPLALLDKHFRVVIDEKAKLVPKIIISAGERGVQIEISPIDIAKLTNGVFFPISSENESFTEYN